MRLLIWHELTVLFISSHSEFSSSWLMSKTNVSVSNPAPKGNEAEQQQTQQKKIKVQAEKYGSAGVPVLLSFNSPGEMIKGLAVAASYMASSSHPAADCCSPPAAARANSLQPLSNWHTPAAKKHKEVWRWVYTVKLYYSINWQYKLLLVLNNINKYFGKSKAPKWHPSLTQSSLTQSLTFHLSFSDRVCIVRFIAVDQLTKMSTRSKWASKFLKLKFKL